MQPRADSPAWRATPLRAWLSARLGAVRAGASVVMLAVLLPRLHFGQLLPRAHQSSTFLFLLLAFLTCLAGIGLSAWRWQRVLVILDVDTGLGSLVSHYFAGSFVGNFLPSTIGGDILRISRLSGTTGTSAATSFASVVLERMTGWLVLPMLALTGLSLRPSLLRLGLASRLAVGLSLATLVLLVALLVLAGSRTTAGRFAAAGDGPPGRTRRARLFGRLARVVSAVHLGVAGLRRRPAAAFGLIGVAVVYQLSTVLAAWLATLALGLRLPVLALLAFTPVVAMAQVIPISLAGLGLREGAFVVLLGPLGVSASAAIAVGLLVYALSLATSLLGAPAFAAGGGRARTLPV